MKRLNIFLVLILLVVLIIIILSTSSYVGYIYSLTSKTPIGGTWVGNSQAWNFYFGLLVYLTFFIPFLFTVFHKNWKKYLFFLLSPLIWIDLSGGFYFSLFIDIIIIICGWLLGEVILLVYKSSKSSKLKK